MKSNVSRFIDFVVERHRIYLRRSSGHLKPWTQDPILQNYRFCNVYRELDTETIWLHNNWLTEVEKKGTSFVWFAAAVARQINKYETLAKLPLPVPWNPDKTKAIIDDMMNRGITTYSSAYIVSTHGVKRIKSDYIIDDICTPLWNDRLLISNYLTSLFDLHSILINYFGIANFMAGQIIADAKHFEPLKHSEDWHTWATGGPGSIRGLHRVRNESVSRYTKANDEVWLKDLNKLQSNVNNKFAQLNWTLLDAQNTQNCLCEFDKYERARLGEGRPKQRYPGVA